MVNPNKYIRTAFRTALAGIGAPVWSKKVPKDVKPVPKLYVLLASQTKNRTAVDKDSFEWLCTILFDITSIMEQGYTDTDLLDDLEEEIITIIEGDVPVAGFTVKDITFVDSRDLTADTSSQTVERRLLTYQFWLSNEDG